MWIKQRELPLFLILALLGLLITPLVVFSAPTGPQLVSNTTESPTARSALMLNTTGGSVTTVVLNGTSQNLGWKAYVGNISGKLVLQDADNYSVFEWDLSMTTGEIYASRRSTPVDWAELECAHNNDVASEDSTMNKNPEDVDSINNTFSNTTHREFYSGGVHFAADACDFTTATYVTSQVQYDSFQEVVLYDGVYIVYASLLENSIPGYNSGKYDFQMILAEDDETSVNTAYYFYVELG